MAQKGKLYAAGLAFVACAALSSSAFAYTAAGDRLFPATLLLPQIAPADEFYVNYSTLPLHNTGPGTPDRSSSLTLTYAKTITDRLGIYLDEGYTANDLRKGGTQYGWQNLDGELKYNLVTDIPHEFLFTLGLDREAGGTGASRIGASRSGATTPRAYFGKGLGDTDLGYLRPLAITGFTGYQIADIAPRPDQIQAGFVVEYSLPYFQSKVQADLSDPFRSMTPMTEVLFTTPAGKSYGARTTALVAPGVSYAGEGWELAVEALVPATRATGTGVGVTAQVHFSLDFLFPDTLGKPLLTQ